MLTKSSVPQKSTYTPAEAAEILGVSVRSAVWLSPQLFAKCSLRTQVSSTHVNIAAQLVI